MVSSRIVRSMPLVRDLSSLMSKPMARIAASASARGVPGRRRTSSPLLAAWTSYLLGPTEGRGEEDRAVLGTAGRRKLTAGGRRSRRSARHPCRVTPVWLSPLQLQLVAGGEVEALGGDQPDGGFVGSRGIGPPAAQHLDAGQATTDPALEVEIAGPKARKLGRVPSGSTAAHVDPPRATRVLDERQLAHAGEGVIGLLVGAVSEVGGRGLRDVEATARHEIVDVGPGQEAAVGRVRAARPGDGGHGHAGAEGADGHEQGEACPCGADLRTEPETGGGPPLGHGLIVLLHDCAAKGARATHAVVSAPPATAPGRYRSIDGRARRDRTDRTVPGRGRHGRGPRRVRPAAHDGCCGPCRRGSTSSAPGRVSGAT